MTSHRAIIAVTTSQPGNRAALITVPIAAWASIFVRARIRALICEPGHAANANWDPTMRTGERHVRIAFNEFITHPGLPGFSVDLFSLVARRGGFTLYAADNEYHCRFCARFVNIISSYYNVVTGEANLKQQLQDAENNGIIVLESICHGRHAGWAVIFNLPFLNGFYVL